MKTWLSLMIVGSVLLVPLLVHAQACPTVAVVIPEVVIIDRVPRPIPDPAAETAIIKHFLDYDFNVVDLTHVALQRASGTAGIDRVKATAARAMAGDQVAIRELAVRDGRMADILVVGEAVSTVTVFEALRIPGRPQLLDGRARVEVRAIEVSTGRILAADALHTGGVDFSAPLAGKKSLERGGDKIACRLATSIARSYPFSARCFRPCPILPPVFGVLPFDLSAPVRIRGVNIGQIFATATETELSRSGCKTGQALVADYVITGTISDWKEIKTARIRLPILSTLIQGIACQVSVDARVLDLHTGEFQAYEVTVHLTGIEIFGFRFGVSPRDIARQAARKIAGHLGRTCR